MFLILAHYDDPTALAVYQELCARHSATNVAVLTDADLARGISWSYTHLDGAADSTLRWRDGREISSAAINAVFNRLRYLNPASFAALSETDREYAVGETYALVLSWLTSLRCAVVNPASARGMSGAHRSPLEWLKLAGEVGISTRRAQFTTNARLVSPKGFDAFQPPAGASLAQAASFAAIAPAVSGQLPTLFLESVRPEAPQRLLVVGDSVIGELQEMAESCLALARRTGVSLLECFFVRSSARQEDVWRCAGVETHPQLNAAEIAAVVQLLESGLPVHNAAQA